MNAIKPATNFIDCFKALYPPTIIGLIIYPFIIGGFINWELTDFNELIINFIWLPLFTIPFYITKKKIFYFSATILYFIGGITNLSHWLLIKGPVTASSLFILFSSNQYEAMDFIDFKRDYSLLLLLPYLLFFVISFRISIDHSYNKNTRPYLYAIGMLLILFISLHLYSERFIRKALPIILKSSISFYYEIEKYKDLALKTQRRAVKINATSAPCAKPQIVLIIIGESTSRNHMSLYDYPKKTNPELENADNLIIYNDAVSGYSNTLDAVLFSMSEANLENKKAFSESLTLIDIYKAAGYKTYWLSNQTPIGIWEDLITLFSHKADYTHYVNISGNTSQESMYVPSYDEKLFPILNKCLSEKVKNKFIIVHLMGSHSSYKKRYPTKFSKFNDNRSEKVKTISEYDNSIYYNDYIVDSILNAVNKTSSLNSVITAALYLSDHGENVYDDGEKSGHDYADDLPKCNVEIPFMLWLSSEYKNSNKEKSDLIYERRNMPFVTDDLFHATIDLMNIKTPCFDPKRSVFNIAFDSTRKRILVDGKDYDLK